MSAKSAVSDAQWRKIERYLPETRRDRVMIEAILFRKFSGQSLTDVAELFEITRVRLFQWEHAIEAVLPEIMGSLRLEPASPLARCRSGSRPSYRRDQAMDGVVFEPLRG